MIIEVLQVLILITLGFSVYHMIRSSHYDHKASKTAPLDKDRISYTNLGQLHQERAIMYLIALVYLVIIFVAVGVYLSLAGVVVNV
jgi:hypothetical protein